MFTLVSDYINEMLGGIDINNDAARQQYPFDIRVGCVKMAAPRHERFDFIREFGASELNGIFTGKPFTVNSLLLVFPERHLSVHEQQCLMSAIVRNSAVGNLKSVDIITSSPLIVGNFGRDSINILQWQDDQLHSGRV